MMKKEIIETERLTLRATDYSDAEFFLELLNTPKWLSNIGDRNVLSMEDAHEYIKNKIKPQWKRLGFGNYTVIRKSDGIRMGSCGLYDRDGVEGVDIGFAFLPQFERKGYGFECASKLKSVAIETFNIRQLSAVTNSENVASQKLLEKIGLRFVKTIELPDDDEEILLYALPVE